VPDCRAAHKAPRLQGLAAPVQGRSQGLPGAQPPAQPAAARPALAARPQAGPGRKRTPRPGRTLGWRQARRGAAGARAQVRKTWQLKHLTRLEAIEEEGGEGGLAAVELSFVNTTFTSETRLALRGEAPAALVDLLGALYLFCRCRPLAAPSGPSARSWRGSRAPLARRALSACPAARQAQASPGRSTPPPGVVAPRGLTHAERACGARTPARAGGEAGARARRENEDRMPQVVGCCTPADLERWAAAQRESGALQGAAPGAQRR